MTKGKQDEIKHEGEKGEAGGREGGGREGETLIVAASEGWQQTVS